MVSSVRVNGKKLYYYFLRREVIERPYRDIEIYEMEALDTRSLKFRVACSGGTYVRSLCVDIAARSGNLGCMDSLVRTRVGRFSLADCVTLEQVEQGAFTLFPIKEALSHYPMIPYEPIRDIVQGKRIRVDCEQEEIAIMCEQEVLAIYRREQDDIFRCIRGLW